MEFKQEPNKIEKARNQKILQDSFLSNLSTILSCYPNLTINQHLDGVKLKLSQLNRSVGGKDFIKQSDERIVRATEKYLQDLENDPPQLWNQGEDAILGNEIEDFYERNSGRGK